MVSPTSSTFRQHAVLYTKQLHVLMNFTRANAKTIGYVRNARQFVGVFICIDQANIDYREQGREAPVIG